MTAPVRAIADRRSPQRAAGATYRADIDGLRAVSVVLVVAYHAGWPPLRGGFVGVDVFFVISGYLITGLLVGELRRDATVSLIRFYGRRARRLLPMATLVLVATAVAFQFLLSPLYRGALAGDVRAAALYVGNWHFAGGALLYGTVSADSPVIHYWSLGVEEQFYLGWPLLLLGLAGVLRNRRAAIDWTVVRRRLAVGLGVVFVVSAAMSVLLTPRSAPYAYYGLHTRAWELAAGALLALSVSGRRLGHSTATAAGWIGIIVIVASAVLINSATPFPGIAAAAPVGGAVLVLAAGNRAGTGVGVVLGTRPAAYVGRVSYGWYLWHWPCLVAAGTLAAELGGHDASHGIVLPHGWVTLAAVAVSFGLSVVSHHLVEDPARHAAWLRAARLRSVAVGAALSAATVLASLVVLPASTGAAAGPVLAEVPSGLGGVAPGVIRLTMSPAQASVDRPGDTRDCYDDYQQTTVGSDCVFGDPHGRQAVALVGDSHAQQWLPALDTAARLHHWRLYVWTKEACPVIDLTVRLPQFDERYPWCAIWRTDVLRALAGVAHLRAVVVSHVGTSISDPGRYADPTGAVLTATDIGAEWGRAWARTAAELHRDARQVVVLRDIPQPAADVPGCLAVHGRDDVPCSFTRREAFANSDILLRAERQADPATRVLDVDDLLCPAATCPVIWSDGTIIYRTNDHLTATMAQRLETVLGARLAAIMRPT